MEKQLNTKFSFELLKPDQVGRILSVSTSKVYKLIKAGELPSILVGYSRRIHPEDLELYIDSGRRKDA